MVGCRDHHCQVVLERCRDDQFQFLVVEVSRFLKFVITDLQQVPGVAMEIDTICAVLADIQDLLPVLTEEIPMFQVVCSARTFLSGAPDDACSA